MKTIIVNVSLVFASLLACAIAVELGLRFVFPVYESAARSEYERDDMRIWASRPNRVSRQSHPDTGIPHYVIQNSLGLRQSRNFSDLSATTNLAFFGDSYVANNRLPAPYSFTEPLDYLLNRRGWHFNVLNFGVNGYGTDQAYLYYTDVTRRIRLDKVFYVLCANDLRNIFEMSLFSVDEKNELVRNPMPKPAWWIRLVSRLHITYLVLDLRQRLVHSRAGDVDDYRAVMERRAARQTQKDRRHSNRADNLQRDLLEGQENVDLAQTIRLFQHIMERWRDATESNGAEFYVVLLPTGREEIFKSFLGERFRVISLRDLFVNAMGSFDWGSVQFKKDGHWAEEGNRLAALHLYKTLEADLGLEVTDVAELEQSLVTYYSAFPNGWAPIRAATTASGHADESSWIRQKYLALELDR